MSHGEIYVFECAYGKSQVKELARTPGIAISAAILAGILTEQTSLAAVPAVLATTTLKAASLIATGQAAAGGLISAQTSALTQGAITMLTITKIKVAAVVVAAALVVTGGGVGVYHAVVKPATGSSKPVAVAKKTPTTASKVKLAPANCVACEIGMTAEKVFARLDTDGDKKVTVKEFSRSPGLRSEAEARAAVVRIDTNGNGSLSWAELSKAYRERHAKCPKPTTRLADGRGNRNLFVNVFIMQNDKNGDGAVDKSEFRGSADRFDQMDKNANGKLDDDELAELHNRRMQDTKSMDERLKSGDLPHRLPWMAQDGAKRPTGPPEPNTD